MKVTSKTSTKRILKGLKSLFKNGDWIQELYEDEKGNEQVCYCLVGGVRKVCDFQNTDNMRPHDRALKALASVIPKEYHVSRQGIPRSASSIVIAYNDEKDRTIDQINNVIDKAIGE